MKKTMTYVIARQHRGLNIPTALQVSAIRGYLDQKEIPFSLPITEWYNPPVYSRLFENIESGEYSEICVYSLKMLPKIDTNHHKVFMNLAQKYNLTVRSVLEDSEIGISEYESFLVINYVYPALRLNYYKVLSNFYSLINNSVCRSISE